jgi:hypothetical protein
MREAIKGGNEGGNQGVPEAIKGGIEGGNQGYLRQSREAMREAMQGGHQ